MSGLNIFDRAADRLRGRWVQGTFRDDAGNVCMVGAISSALQEEGENKATGDWGVHIAFLESLVEAETGFDAPETFNDDPSTSEEDVLLMFKKAAVAWDEAQGA